jgi:uncharacterized protein (TIGR02453 family)
MSYFDKETFRFLRDLERNNNRPWFHANKDRYEATVRDPFLRLITDLQVPLSSVSAHYRADPKSVGGSLFRIQRDTRFANDKTPYKTSAGARFFHERGRNVEAPVFYFHLQPGSCFVAAGLWHPSPDSQRRLRSFLVDNPDAWTRAVHSPAFRRRFEMDGDTLVRAPRGFDPNHPLIDDIKRKDFVASRPLDDATVLGTRLRQSLVDEFSRLAPLVDYLCAALDLEF